MARRPIFRTSVGGLALLVVALGIFPASVLAGGRDDGVKRIERSKEYLDTIMQAPDSEIPADVLRGARGIIIVRQFKAGFGLGVKGGSGLAMLRNQQTGAWSPPVFLRTGEGSIGWQLGGQSIDSIFLIMNEEGVEMLLKTKFKVGVDASAAAGPVGRDAEAKVGAGTAILAYSRAKGLFAGASFEGGLTLIDGEINEAFYGRENADIRRILLDNNVPMPPEAEPLVQALLAYAGQPGATTQPASPPTTPDSERVAPAPVVSQDGVAEGRAKLLEIQKLRDDKLVSEEEYQELRRGVLEKYFQ